LMILLIALAVAVVWLWVVKRPDEAQTFDRIYQVSVTQATGNFILEATLGMPSRSKPHKPKCSTIFTTRTGGNTYASVFPCRVRMGRH